MSPRESSMSSRLIAAVLLLALSTGCGPTRIVRLDTGQSAPREHRPPTPSQSVKVEADAFEDALTQLVLELPLLLRPSQQGRLVRASYPSQGPDTHWQRRFKHTDGSITINTAFVPP